MTEAGRPDRVLVVDDHRTFADLMALALAGEPGFTCVGAAHDAATARALAAEMCPDVVLVDVNLGADDGIDLATELMAGRPDLRVVILTAHADQAAMQRSAIAGACAFLPKNGSLPELLSILRTARPGGLAVYPALLQSLILHEGAMPARGSRPTLTPREQRVLELLSEGRDVRSISRQLHISVNTCRGYVKTLLAKLDAHSQLEAVVIAGTQGLLGASGTR